MKPRPRGHDQGHRVQRRQLPDAEPRSRYGEAEEVAPARNAEQEPSAEPLDDGVALMQKFTRGNWLQALQDDLEKLRKAGVQVGNHVDQLRRRCHQEAHHYQDLEGWQTALAVMAAYVTDQGEEHRVDAVDQWADKWYMRISAMLRLPDGPQCCLDSQEQEECEATRSTILHLINNEFRNQVEACRAQAEDDEAMRMAMNDTAKPREVEDKGMEECERKKQKTSRASAPAILLGSAVARLPTWMGSSSSSSESVVIVVPEGMRVELKPGEFGKGTIVTIDPGSVSSPGEE